MPCIHSAGNKLFIDEHLGVSKEEHGIFVYRATVSVAVRTIPSVDDDCRTTKDILPQVMFPECSLNVPFTFTECSLNIT
jgi:hypothetical protein